MIPNLVEVTWNYWHKLDALEAAYQRGEVSLEEVDKRVSDLMEELGRERRKTLSYLRQSWRQWLTSNQEVLIGVLVLASIAYTWASTTRVS